MSMQIIGEVDKNRLFCSGSFTKLLTTFVCLSLLSENYNLKDILDDENFLDQIANNEDAKKFLLLFQDLIKNKFSIRDLCSFYAGLPYTFDVSQEELRKVEAGEAFKHHSILDEKTFFSMCEKHITPLYTRQCKFHYSELSIIFLGYFIEKVYSLKIEDLYKKYILDKFQLKHSLFSRYLPKDVYLQDLSDRYDYPSIAILDHGYFCYSNGFYTTLSDMKTLLENMLFTPIFKEMSDLKQARAASNTIINGLTVEIRLKDDDIIYGYEGLSFSGCNIWAYSTKYKQGFLTFTNDEEAAYPIIYDQWDYQQFDKAPPYTQVIYQNFLKNDQKKESPLPILLAYQGNYQRVRINEKKLELIFVAADHFIIIRDPDPVKFQIIEVNGDYYIKGRDGIHGAKIGFTQLNNDRYMYHDGTLYKKITD